jgi:hypothetical protein
LMPHLAQPRRDREVRMKTIQKRSSGPNAVQVSVTMTPPVPRCSRPVGPQTRRRSSRPRGPSPGRPVVPRGGAARPHPIPPGQRGSGLAREPIQAFPDWSCRSRRRIVPDRMIPSQEVVEIVAQGGQ